MSTDGGAPLVSGISPVEGPPGTNVKIRGENLGLGPEDVLGVFICNVNCTYTAEWKSSSLIHARTGVGKGMGDIIVFTKSGKMGTSLVKFRGITPRVGLLTEAAVWVDESKLFEEKSKTALSNSRMVTSTTYVDPLGVAPEETGALLSPDQIEQWYPGCSSNPLSENFNPSRFLLERHLDTSFHSLKAGYYHLQSQDNRISVGPISFVRGNLPTILDALYTLNAVQKSMTNHESESIGGNICEELQGVLKSCNFASNSLFKDILTRKDECDSKRNVLNVLHRYRFLFNLPRSIEKNIQQGEYEILISDYNRARALFQNTQVKSFQKALTEVDQKISAFSKKLKQKLFDFPTPLEEQKRIIRYLNDLNYPNAGWECVKKQSLWVKSLLLDCQVEHNMQEGSLNALTTMQGSTNNLHSSGTNLLASTHSRASSETNAPFTKSHQRTASLPESLRRLQAVPSGTPQCILMVNELCKLITGNLPDLWNLGQTYINNQAAEKKEHIGKASEERENFQALVKDVIIVFCEMVQTVVQPDEIGKLNPVKERKSKNIIPWLPEAVRSVRSTLQRMDRLGLTEDVISPLKALTTSCIADCLKKVLTATVEEVQQLYKRETWDLEYDRRNFYWTSKLPTLFEMIFGESVQFVHDFMMDSKIETKNESRTLHKDVTSLLKTMLEAFLVTLEKTIFRDNTESNESLDVDVEENGGDVPKDFQVVVLLSNCYHVKNIVIPNVLGLCTKRGYGEINSLTEEINNAIDKLEERVFSTYMDIKGEPIVGSIELGMNMAECNWKAAKPVKGIRSYLQDLFMKLVYIHDQISSVSPLFTKKIFVAMIDIIVDELHRSFECIEEFSPTGSLQAHLELESIKQSLELYISNQAREKIDAIFKRLPALDEKHDIKLQKLVNLFKENMRYQLVTFTLPDKKAPMDSKERYRSQSIEALDTKLQTISLANQENQEQNKLKLKTKQSWGAQIEVIKSTSSTLLQEAATDKFSNKNPFIDNTKKKTKRHAPAPPSLLSTASTFKQSELGTSNYSKDTEIQLDSTNPFLDDDGEV